MDNPRTVERYIIEDSTLSDEEKIDRLAHLLDPENWESFERLSVEVEEDFLWESGDHIEQPDEYWEKILNAAYDRILARHPELGGGDDGDDGLPF